jgi:hypothetical protein
MRILIELVSHLMFWHRKWEVVCQKSMSWKRNGLDYKRLLVLEKCAYTGFERAYYHDHYHNKESLPVNVAKIKLELIK